MEMRFIASNKELSMFANRTYVPLSLLATGHKDAELDFWLDDVNGFQLEQVFLDEIPERRNGLPSHSYSYSYDGIMHIFPLNNNSETDVSQILKVNRLMVYPYTYILPYYNDGTPTYDKNTTEILKLINQDIVPSAIRVCFQQITTIHNNGIGANKEFDLHFSVYGIWNKDGLMRL